MKEKWGVVFFSMECLRMSYLFKRKPYKIKQLIIGDTGVGKSTLVARMANKPLPDSCTTIGCSISNIPVSSNGLLYDIDISVWDTAGQERYFPILDLYFRDVDVCFLVYDINDLNSLERIFTVWMPRFLNSKHTNESNNKLYYLIGNKDDINISDVSSGDEDSVGVICKKYEDIMMKYGIKLWRISALKYYNINELIETVHKDLTEYLLNKSKQSVISSSTAIIPAPVPPHANGVLQGDTWWFPSRWFATKNTHIDNSITQRTTNTSPSSDVIEMGVISENTKKGYNCVVL